MGSAVKIFKLEKNFQIELECYQRLGKCGISKIRGFAVPELLDLDRRLMVIEMTIVEPPYVLDFAKCYIDRTPDYGMQMVYRDLPYLFEEHAAEVRKLISALQSHGIYYAGAKPGNIRFAN